VMRKPWGREGSSGIDFEDCRSVFRGFRGAGESPLGLWERSMGPDQSADFEKGWA
jgi:hypothetical protein